MSVAASVRRSKERHPKRYCSAPGCLWRVLNARTGERTPCPRHGVPIVDFSRAARRGHPDDAYPDAYGEEPPRG